MASSRFESSLRGRLRRVHRQRPAIPVTLAHDNDNGDAARRYPPRRVTSLGYTVMCIMILAEYMTWTRMNSEIVENIIVASNTSSQTTMKQIRVNLNITFPALHCADVHLDVMNVAGDSRLDIDNSNEMMKQRLDLKDGTPIAQQHTTTQQPIGYTDDNLRYPDDDYTASDDYCGTCYVIYNKLPDCCLICDEIIKARQIVNTAEQCIREGRGSTYRIVPYQMKRMTGGEGCNLSGNFYIAREGAGNFHIAMGLANNRDDGRHVHQFFPEDRINFNVSHVVHELSFGDVDMNDMKGYDTIIGNKVGSGNEKSMSLNGVTKVVTKETGTTGLFQYFIKIVPTIYKGDIFDDVLPREQSASLLPQSKPKISETNRYRYTERFLSLFEDVHNNEATASLSNDDDDPSYKGIPGLRGKKIISNTEPQQQKKVTKENNPNNQSTANNILPGVYFMYEVYPFAVEVAKKSVPLVHLCMWIVVTILIIIGLS